MKKIISALLAILLLTSSLSSVVLADNKESESITTMMVQVSNGKTAEYYEVISQDEELYFSDEDFGKVTNYKLGKAETYCYKLGEKKVVIDLKTGDVKVSVWGYKGNIGKPIQHNDKYYFSASKLLPLLNVECSVEGGIFYIVPDESSLWSILEEVNYKDYMFNFYDTYSDVTAPATELEAMVLLDGFINLKMDRVTSQADLTSRYIAAFAEISKEGIAYNTNVVGTVQGLDSFEDVFGEGAKNSDIQALKEQWDTIVAASKSSEKRTAYADIFSAYKTYELMIETDGEYREYLSWLSDKGKISPTINSTFKKVDKSLEENEDKLYPFLADFSKPVLSAVDSSVFKAMADSSLDQKVVNSFNQQMGASAVCQNLPNYGTVTETFYGNLVSDEVKGYEGIERANVLETIQDYCWNMAFNLQEESMTGENIMRIRQSYLTALRASKLLYESCGEIWESEKDISKTISKIDEKIKQLVVSIDATENDAALTGEKASEDIKKLIKEVKLVTVEKYKLWQVLNTQKCKALLLETAWVIGGSDFKFSSEQELLQRLSTYVFCGFGCVFADRYKWNANYEYVVPEKDVYNKIYNVFGVKVSRGQIRTGEGLRYSGGYYYIGGSDGPLQGYRIIGTEETETGYLAKIGIYYEDWGDGGEPREVYGGQYRFQVEYCDNDTGMKIVAITRAR